MVAGGARIDNRSMNRTIAGPRALLVLAVTLLAVPGVAGCGSSAPARAAGWTAPPAADARDTAWQSRPAYVRADAQTEEAYAFAMAHADVLQWIPCYCGCTAMGHRSNLDCFFKPTNDGLTTLRFEEHASACQVCVEEALMAKRLVAEGQSLRAIRAAIDASFGGNGAPGTQTDLPPA
jgi:uncharacterized protein with PCYCGC motif